MPMKTWPRATSMPASPAGSRDDQQDESHQPEPYP